MDAPDRRIDVELPENERASEFRRSLREPIEDEELPAADEPELLLAHSGRSWGP